MRLWGWGSDPKPALSTDLDVNQVSKQGTTTATVPAPQPHDQKTQKPEATAALRRAAQPSIKETLQHIGPEDFKQANKIPCMRSAMLAGVGIGAVTGGIMAIAKRPLGKAANWAVVGFFTGAVFSWEQCRFRRRQSKRNVFNAREAYSNK